MSTPVPAAKDSVPAKPFCPVELAKKHLQPYACPYYLTIAGVLGAATAGFVAVIVLLILVAANFNVLGLIE